MKIYRIRYWYGDSGVTGFALVKGKHQGDALMRFAAQSKIYNINRVDIEDMKASEVIE